MFQFEKEKGYFALKTDFLGSADLRVLERAVTVSGVNWEYFKTGTEVISYAFAYHILLRYNTFQQNTIKFEDIFVEATPEDDNNCWGRYISRFKK